MNSAYPLTWDKLYEKTVNSLRIGLFRTDSDGNILDADAGLIKILHFPDLPSLRAASSNGLWGSTKDREAFFHLLDSNPGAQQWQGTLRCFDGTPIWVELTAYANQNGQGNTRFYEGVLQDISGKMTAELERQKVLDRLEKNEHIFRALIENSSDGLMVLNKKGGILYFSPSSRAIIGFSPEEVLGKHLMEIVHPDDRLLISKTFEDILCSAKRSILFQCRINHKNGTWRWAEGKGTNLLDDPIMQGIVLNFRDITEQKIAENKLREDEEEIHYRAEFERLILGISTRLINIPTEQMIKEFEKVLSEVGNFTRVDRCQIFLFSPDQKTMRCVATWNREGIPGPTCEKLQNLPSDVSSEWLSKMQAHEVFYFTPTSRTSREEQALLNSVSQLEEKSIIDVPIVSHGHLVGYLGLSSVREERQWTKDEIGLQKLLAEIIANSLERQEAENQIRRQLDNLAALHKIEKAITSKAEIGSVMNVVLEQVTSQLRIDAAVILLYDVKSSSLYFGSGRGFKPGRATTALRYLQNPLLERVVAERQMLHLPIPHDWKDIWGNEGFTVYFGVPLVAKGDVKGVLELYHRVPFEPTEEWKTFMFMIAEQAAIAIDNVTLFQDLQRSLRNLNQANRELQQAYDTTLEGWARALELRHRESEKHSTRVVDWTMRLAKTLSLDGEALVHMRRGALLHDIGKMGVPDTILLKTGALGTEDWVVMKKHPEMAYEMLYPIQYLRPALDIPYCHHEWWDGSGYPRGLKGEEIPLPARIFTVIDIWDALTQDRWYRPEPERKWPPKRAMEYLREEAGKKLDPRVVDAFLNLLKSETR